MVVASIVLAAAAAPQAQAAGGASPYKAPRNIYGQPVLAGTWSNETLTRMERGLQYGPTLVPSAADLAKVEGTQQAKVQAGKGDGEDPFRAECETAAGAFNIQCSYGQAWFDDTPHLMRVNGQPRTSLITSTADGRIPRLPNAPRPGGFGPGGKADNPEDRGLPDRCLVSQNYTTGALLNTSIYNNNWLFQQNRDSVVIVAEMSHDARIVRLNARHDDIPRWLGDSVGHWEGDTLVVDTINFHPTQLAYNTPALHLVERFTRVGEGRLLYQFRVEDPGVYSQPWSGEYEFTTAKGLQYEYACHEGNYAMAGILEGARAEERAAGKGVARVSHAPVPDGPEGEE
ncbi:MAG: hypothetical protein B7Y99_10965 [Caulobacterales bacterium 32-69-10]|nr:MAG: hypothetical protein B7Y99_10965 [Caulobacterales bacterium 32-69-10]